MIVSFWAVPCQQVYLIQQHNFGPVNLIAAWSPNQDMLHYWALDLPAEESPTILD
jgi:hypothetical protein